MQEEANSNLPTVVEITMTKSQMMTPACCEDYDDAPHKLHLKPSHVILKTDKKDEDHLFYRC